MSVATDLDAKFESYMARVDNALERICGLTSDCLPDYDYWGAFEDELPVDELAHDVLESAGW